MRSDRSGAQSRRRRGRRARHSFRVDEQFVDEHGVQRAMALRAVGIPDADEDIPTRRPPEAGRFSLRRGRSPIR